jgi:hypothetical protein
MKVLIVLSVVVLLTGSGLANHEQRLQEQPSRVVRLDVRHPAPR